MYEIFITHISYMTGLKGMNAFYDIDTFFIPHLLGLLRKTEQG